MANRLAHELSPYLLQHAENPVDWWPWCDEAIERARETDRPIFLSIGYSACHWCHVMEHESFENAELAAVLNEHFVNIKVDREERPDLDQLYMNAVQMITGRGGWPMSVFLDHQLRPFFAGTYWPASARMGMPGFDSVLQQVHAAWREQRDKIESQAAAIAEKLAQVAAAPEARGELSGGLLRDAAAHLERAFDHTHGGFGGAPKFPHPMDLAVLLRYWRHHSGDAVLAMVTHTLDKMAAGGINDHLSGGFARYSVDERWLVPHFEKMLYDNALLARCYVEAYQATGNEAYAQVARETLDFVLRDMTDPAGGFYSALDADSEGVEGKYYVWTPEEIGAVLDEETARVFSYVYDVTPQGNFEGKSILNRSKTLDQCATILQIPVDELRATLDGARQALLAERGGRIPPATDDKVLVSWNGLAIDALALAGSALGEQRYVQAAQRAARFILEHMRSDQQTLLHTYRAGSARYDAYLDDYAALASALVTLYEADFDEAWIDHAAELVDQMRTLFADQEGGGFYFTRDGAAMPVARHKDYQDASVPSGNALAATALVRLGRLTGREDYLAAAQQTMETFARVMERSPSAAGQLLLALDSFQSTPKELVLVGAADDAGMARTLAHLRRKYLPGVSVACRSPGDGAHRSKHLEGAFAGKEAEHPELQLYVCSGFTCRAPVEGSNAAIAAIDRLAQGE